VDAHRTCGGGAPTSGRHAALPIDEVALLAFMGYAWTPWIITVLAVAELVTDQLPSTPSRTVPVQFGTLGGRVARAALARKFGNDRPAALLEDVVAIAAALLNRQSVCVN
jgi:uncharacterized membrane protein